MRIEKNKMESYAICALSAIALIFLMYSIIDTNILPMAGIAALIDILVIFTSFTKVADKNIFHKNYTSSIIAIFAPSLLRNPVLTTRV